ncbi:uncharacterized protein BCR38DRAFT_436960 [Pseudomassariella vexata]|uniref:Uncharacterized protein n=1 Tax=Pseudomassariella vexata TaxID=1141098 RepID=A0A1Y2DW42_9PEZI|nr:uncharacterized protein BCR38DRAFT_436960 [Pseudomassariella vexata]ORY63483.1 hypothetical protein BCR38DRAFT_436960 [Pseudomassariella vexata]
MEPELGRRSLVRITVYEQKQKVDPRAVFYAPTAVGSEDWYIARQDDWLTLHIDT